MTTGEKIAALRREKGLSQEGLGEQLGLSRQAVFFCCLPGFLCNSHRDFTEILRCARAFAGLPHCLCPGRVIQ